jgi:hypothetical protein
LNGEGGRLQTDPDGSKTGSKTGSTQDPKERNFDLENICIGDFEIAAPQISGSSERHDLANAHNVVVTGSILEG